MSLAAVSVAASSALQQAPGTPALQRARGALILGFDAPGGVTRLSRLRQEGCLKARFPRPETGAWAGAVLLNTSGGLTGGDDLATTLSLGPGARVTLVGQSAERIYRALPDTPPARVRLDVVVGQGASLELLPQETILFDRAALRRTLDVHLAPDACYLGVETLVFGRARMGETVTALRLYDRLRLFRDGAALLQDAVAVTDAAVLAAAAGAAGARAAATIVVVAPDAAGRLDAVRQAIDRWGGERGGASGGASARGGTLVAKLLASDAQALRSVVVACLAVLRDARPLPRVWSC